MGLDVLVVGGGGREHALVAGLRRSPDLGRLFCAPGNAGIGRDAALVPIAADDSTAWLDFAAARGHRSDDRGTGGAAGGGHRRRVPRSRVDRLRSVGGGGSSRRLEIVRQGSHGRRRRAHGAGGDVQRLRVRPRLREGVGRAHRGEGRRSRRRQGRHGGSDPRPGRCGPARMLPRRALRAGREGRAAGGVPGGRGGLAARRSSAMVRFCRWRPPRTTSAYSTATKAPIPGAWAATRRCPA